MSALKSTPSGPSRVLILGTGIAGLSTAIKFADQGVEVTLLTKASIDEGATRYAQGGIASVWSREDSFAEHKKDTVVAGGGLCREDIVDLCVREGPARVQELIDLGVHFTKAQHEPGRGSRGPMTGTDPAEEFDLHREGGHGQRRILHADDLTGWEIERALIAQVRARSNISVLEYHVAIDLITEGKVFGKTKRPGRVLGVYALNEKTGQVVTFGAEVVVLSTGGAGKVYLYTSNPDVATGDGIAMAYRAGARVANLEFMQFHPTCLYHPGARTFLISEALRGEGAVLRTIAGETFMEKHHPMGSLAPRDVVARAIDLEMKRTGHRHVLLDATAIGAEKLKQKFPNIYEACLKLGLDISLEPIPVVPAMHYACGGVKVNEWGESTIERLYAVGEVACTGLHGANRLASNSLLEAVVFAHRVVAHAAEKWLPGPRDSRALPPSLPEWDIGLAVPLEEQIDIAANWLEVRTLMWNYVGIVRSDRRLERARRRIELLRSEINTYYWNYLLTRDLIELRNLVQIADLIIQCATSRKESRGLHFTVDYPESDDLAFLHDTVI